MYRDGDDDDQPAQEKKPDGPGDAKAGDYNMGDDIGERVGEGHDPVEDEVT